MRLAVFWAVFGVGTLIAVIVALPIAASGGRPLRRHVRGWTRFHAWCARRLLGIHVVVEGTVPSGQPVLIASKHQAMLETFELIRICGDPAILAKQELTRIPLWGRVARRYGVIPVDREGAATALRTMLRAGRQAIVDGRAIIIFPEGTRVLPGERPALRPGFAGLYRALAIPVVPVALDSGRLWPRDRLTKRPGTVHIRFGEPISPGLAREEIEARVHEAINALDEPAFFVRRSP